MTGPRRDDATLERQLWLAANKLRHHLDAAAYKHLVLGLVFLRWALGRGDDNSWSALIAAKDHPDLGTRLDAALLALAATDTNLAGVLTPRYAGAGLDDRRLGELVALIDGIDLTGAADLLGRIYEYFLAEFAGAEGSKSGQFYTPRGVVELLVATLAPRRGSLYDPCCGSGGMFVQAARAVPEDICLFGQESNPTTWRLARMNLALRGLRGDLGPGPADTLNHDLHPDLRADVILANPPFNASDWGEPRTDDPRWRFGRPPARNANFAWVQHVLHHLAPAGRAGVVLACGSLSAQRFGEGQIRRAIVEADLLDCVVALPTQLFYATPIPACIWLFAADRRGGDGRDRRGEILFIDARRLGAMTSRTLRQLGTDDITTIAAAYHHFRAAPNIDTPGFARAVSVAELARHDFVLTPGRHVGSPLAAAPTEPAAARLRRLARELDEQLTRSAELDTAVRQLVKTLDHD